LVIHNPAAGRRRNLLARTLRRLRGLGCRVEVRQTAARGDAAAIARAASGCDAVVAAGGDGTIGEVINGLIAANPAIPLAVLPLGTANVLAAEMNLPADPSALAQVIARGEARPVSLGRVRDQAGRVTHFAMMAGAGFDAHVVAGIDLRLKRLFGKGAYVAESLRQLAIFRFPRYRVTIDGVATEAASVIVANGRHYAGRYVCAPEARLDQPVLQVCLFDTGGAMAVLRYVLALQSGGLARRADVRIVAGRRVVISAPEGEPLQADGDIVARLPVEIDVVPDALRLVMP
jgi:YegS/Rv2252/BmrU family lipid kinase